MSDGKQMIDALQILGSYIGGDVEKLHISAEHDQVWVAPYSVSDEIEVSEEDAKKLDELGWFWDDDCWSSFC